MSAGIRFWFVGPSETHSCQGGKTGRDGDGGAGWHSSPFLGGECVREVGLIWNDRDEYGRQRLGVFGQVLLGVVVVVVCKFLKRSFFGEGGAGFFLVPDLREGGGARFVERV